MSLAIEYNVEDSAPEIHIEDEEAPTFYGASNASFANNKAI